MADAISATSAAPTSSIEENQMVRNNMEFQSIQSAYRLNGKNYLKWSQLVRTFLKGKGKIGHLLGTGPEKGTAGFEAWDEEDSMIMSWLWNSMTPEISDTCMFLPSAKAIWDTVYQTYSKVHDAALIYEIKTKTTATKQGTKSVTEYANLLQNQWQELDYYRTIDLKCSDCAVAVKRFIERDRVYDFLAGLNSEFDLVRIQILGRPEVPSLNETVSLVRVEESSRGIMLDLPSVDSSALLSSKPQGFTFDKPDAKKNNNRSFRPQKSTPRDELWCTYCKKPRHTKEHCWKLYGKPSTHSQEWGQRGEQPRQTQGQAHVTVQNPTQGFGGLSIEDMEKLKNLLGSMDKLATKPDTQASSQGRCSLTLSGKEPISLGLNALGDEFRNAWILDSGATDHMTHSSNHFKTYTPCPSSRKITVADGTTTTVAGLGDVQVNSDLILKNVLHVPRLSMNLISIHKLTQDLPCRITFFTSYCEFQDQDSGKKIGLAKEHNGLYYLSASNQPELIKSVLSTSLFSLSNKDVIWLHHRRLGHLSFSKLKIMFPNLFKGLNVQSFHCDICEFAKHTRVPFPISNKKSSSPFFLIHSDIWGPSTIPNITGSRWFVTFIDDCTRVSWIYLLKNKSDVSHVFPVFHSMIKNQFGTKIKRIRSDNARDYFNQTLSPYFQTEGIIHESSCIITPQQNGVAERKNRHLLECTRALLFEQNVPKHYWGEAILTSAYVINRMPSRVLEFQSPLETLSQFFPDIRSSFNLTPRVFGCTSFVHVHNHNRGKLDPRALKCVFVGYSTTQKGYKCYHPHTRKLYVTSDVTFVENKPYFSTPSIQGELPTFEDKELDLSLDISSSKSPKTSSKPSEFFDPISNPSSSQPVESVVKKKKRWKNL